MPEEKKGEVHPLVHEVLSLAYSGVEPIELPGWAIEDLKRSLARYFGKPDLLKAVVDLINLAGILEKEGSPNTAMHLIEIVCTAANALQDQTEKKKQLNLENSLEKKDDI